MGANSGKITFPYRADTKKESHGASPQPLTNDTQVAAKELYDKTGTATT